MKRFIVFAFAALAVFPACNKEFDMAQDSPSCEYSCFNASIASGDSKAHFESSNSVKWDIADEIRIFSDDNSNAGTYSRTAGNAFSGERIRGSIFYAYFPADASQDAGNPMIVKVPEFQAVFGSGRLRFPMAAKSPDNNLEFRQTCGVLHFVLSGIEERFNVIALSGNNNEPLCGEGIVDLSADIPVFELDKGNASTVFAAFMPDSVNPDTKYDVYFPIPPTEFEKGFTLTLYEMNDEHTSILNSFSKSTSKHVSVKRAEMAKYVFSLALDEDDDDSVARQKNIDYIVPKDAVRISPNASLLGVEDFGISATMAGEPLEVRLYTLSNWITILADTYAGIQGNTTVQKRRSLIQARFYKDETVQLRKSFWVEQDAVSMSLDFQSNKADHYYFRSFNEQGLNYLYFTPYGGEQSFSVTCNYPDLLQHTSVSLTHDGSSLWADDGVCPEVTKTVDGNIVRYGLSYPSNRNYIEKTLPKGDVYYNGQAREGAVGVRASVIIIDDWYSVTYHTEEVKDNAGNPLMATVCSAQAGIELSSPLSWAHVTYPLADSDTPGYSRVEGLKGENELTAWDSIASNVTWSKSDLEMNNSPFSVQMTDMDVQSQKNYHVTTYRLYAQENGTAAQRASGSEPFRNTSDIPVREGTMYVRIDLHDGGEALKWPVMRIIQLGVPAIQFIPEDCYWTGWTKGTFTGSNGGVFSFKTDLYFSVDVNRDLVMEMDSYESFHLGQWQRTSLASANSYSYTVLSNSDADQVTGTEDLKLVYRNGRTVYAAQPYSYTFGEPLPFMTARGIGDIKLGMSVGSIPSQIPNLYDSLTTAVVEVTGEGGYDEFVTVYRAKWKGETMFDIYYDDGWVYSLNVLSPRLKTVNGLGLSSTARELWAAGAVVQTYNDFTYDVCCDGVHFMNVGFSEAGLRKLEQCFINGIDLTFYLSDMLPDSSATDIRIW